LTPVRRGGAPVTAAAVGDLTSAPHADPLTPKTDDRIADALASAEGAMIAERRVRLFRNGRNQAVRIPREFELPGKEAILRKEGERLILEPAQPKSLLAVLATLAPLDEEFPPIQELDLDPVEL
jgi:antitoxin VapB